MKELVFLLEEESAKALIESLLAKLQCQIHHRLIVFQGKQDLEKQIERKLRGYLNSDVRFIILRDQDQGDCRVIKKSLKAKCKRAGRTDAIIRIACRELEAFYLGDLAAVEAGLGIKGLSAKQAIAKFRNPDSLQSPSAELLKLTNGRYQKIAGSRAIAPHLNIDSTRSKSFHHLVQAIRKASL